MIVQICGQGIVEKITQFFGGAMLLQEICIAEKGAGSQHFPDNQKSVVIACRSVKLPSASIEMRSRITARALVYGGVITLLITFYVLLLGRGSGSWAGCFLGTDGSGPYGDLADAFVHGQTDLLVAPDASLLAVKNPREIYVTEERPPEIKFIWDYSYYKNSHSPSGRYYLYFGPGPALLFFCPPVLIAHFHPSTSLVLLIISSLQVLVFAALLWFLVADVFTLAPLWLEGVLLGVLGICDITPAFLDRPQVYELAVASGMLFSMACCFFLFRALISVRHRYLWMVLSGTSWGLAMSSRPVDVLLGAVLLLAWVYVVLGRDFKNARWDGIRSAICLFLPGIICGLSLMYYDYVRFDNPFETGLKYQLNGIGNYDKIYFSLRNIPDGLWSYYLVPYQFVHQFPFIDYWNYSPSFIYGTNLKDFHTGLLTSFPICLVGFAWPYFVSKMQDAPARKVAAVFGWLVSAWMVVIMLCLSAYFVIAFRHEAELLWPMLLLFAIAVLARRHALGPFNKWELAVLSLLVIYSCLIGFIYGLIGPWRWIEDYMNHGAPGS